MTQCRKFRDVLIEDLKNPEEAKAYLEVALEEYEQDGDMEALLMALRHVAEAQGNVNVSLMGGDRGGGGDMTANEV